MITKFRIFILLTITILISVFISIFFSKPEAISPNARAEIAEKLSHTLMELKAGAKGSTVDVYIDGCIITWMAIYPELINGRDEGNIISHSTSVDIRMFDTRKKKVPVRELSRASSVTWRVEGAAYFQPYERFYLEVYPKSAKELFMLRENKVFENFPNFRFGVYRANKPTLAPIKQSLGVYISKDLANDLADQMRLFSKECTP